MLREKFECIQVGEGGPHRAGTERVGGVRPGEVSQGGDREG